MLGWSRWSTPSSVLPPPADQVGAALCQPRPRSRRERLSHGHQRQPQPGPVQHRHQRQRDLQPASTTASGTSSRTRPTPEPTPEYYAFGNPQPDLRPDHPRPHQPCGQVVGAAHDVDAPNGYLFDQETITVTPSNGFLQNVWWSNYESYSSTGELFDLQLQLEAELRHRQRATSTVQPGLLRARRLSLRPVYTNDSVFVSGNGRRVRLTVLRHLVDRAAGIDRDHGRPQLPVRRRRTTAWVERKPLPTAANATWPEGRPCHHDTTDNSSYDNPVEVPPSSDQQLGTIASQNGCLYSGPTQITLSKGGQMTVVSPDTPRRRSAVCPNGSTNNNLANGNRVSRSTPTTARTTARRRCRPTGSCSSRTPPRPPRRGPTRSTTPSTTR